ncbi:hypothetical protein RHMOL_Rhmol02G0272400 [Rhododendron molle]|uniref:Uncharacterized protein n=1 Tax=Rhododendron molle TaxID=49168 RepID=A0ACC0PWG2_RHOML|nr:hypothetical protein RHMOL_Rhmol02G0272400 [Rhododendron molle]
MVGAGGERGCGCALVAVNGGREVVGMLLPTARTHLQPLRFSNLQKPQLHRTIVLPTLYQRLHRSHQHLCEYEVIYADGFFTIGLFASETLTLTPSDVFLGFAFGCGLHNTSPFSGVTGFSGILAGFLGLGRGPPSLVAQTASKYGSYFSYCLPTLYSSSGTLFFRHSNRLRHLHYVCAAGGIRCSPDEVPVIDDKLHDDSGWVTIRHVLRLQRSRYGGVPDDKLLFGGDVEVPIPFPRILTGSKELNCLAFAGNSNASDFGVSGVGSSRLWMWFMMLLVER